MLTDSSIPALQQDVVDLLERACNLMKVASTQLWSRDGTGDKYEDYRKQISEEARKVKDLELRMAIVAPMKAGKSTIINAIIGQELLPSRNAAMTTLPTEIVLKRKLDEPILQLSKDTLSLFQDAWIALRQKIIDKGTDKLQEIIGQYPHLLELVKEIKKQPDFPATSKTYGRGRIVDTLTKLNDVVRLCSKIEPLKDPLRSLADIPKIETPYWQLQTETPIESWGNLIIVDTPGPNEAGENLRLVGVVEEQLQKSSLVLIVLDYTQLKTCASEEVKNNVERVIRIRGKDSLYAIVNKVDERREGDMNTVEVQQFVASELGLDSSNSNNQIFEIAARRAFRSSNYLLELQQNLNLEIHQNLTARALAQEIFVAKWEGKFQKATREQLELEAWDLWEESGFAPFLEQSINALMIEAAPRCMRVALTISKACLIELQNAVRLRESAIYQDAIKISSEIDNLTNDLLRLEKCQKSLDKEVESKKDGLNKGLHVTLYKLKNKSEKSLQDYFLKQLSERVSNLEKIDIIGRKFFLQPIRIPFLTDILEAIFPESLSRLLKYKFTLIGRNELKFDFKDQAEDFASQIFVEARTIIEPLLVESFGEIQEQIRDVQLDLRRILKLETEEIIEQARKRLEKDFKVDLLLPALFLEDDLNIASDNIEIAILNREKNFFEITMDFFKSLFGGSKSQQREIYVVSLEGVVERINQSIEMKLEETKEAINNYLDNDFQKRTDDFFKSLDAYLKNYQASLDQALNDQRSSLENQERLKKNLSFCIEDSHEILKQINKKLDYLNQLKTIKAG